MCKPFRLRQTAETSQAPTRYDKDVELDGLKPNFCLWLPFPQEKWPHLRCLCSRGPRRDSNPSAAETTTEHDAKRRHTMELRLPRRVLRAEAKSFVLPAGFYFSRSGRPWRRVGEMKPK